VRISTAKLDSLLLQAEEMLSVKLIFQQRAAELKHVVDEFSAWKKEWATVDPKAHLARRLASGSEPEAGGITDALHQFLEWNCDHLKATANRLGAVQRSLQLDLRSTSMRIDGLLEDAKKILMHPCSTLLQTFPKMARDIARQRGKEVDVELRGGSVEIDRRILEEIKDPLIHLVRNSVDHGIEPPETRKRNNKPPQGQLTISVSESRGDKVEIQVTDDGAGIDVERVKRSAVKQGLITDADAENMGTDKAQMLLFESGFSTSPVITDISGRGWGLAIVQEKINNLGGHLSLTTEPEKGTSFRILLPLTLATFRGILVQCADWPFVIPTANVNRATRIKRAEIKTVQNRETIELDGQVYPLVKLADVLGLPTAGGPPDAHDFVTVLVLTAAGRQVGFSVDRLLGEQEILVKSLGRQLARVRNIAGATILGSGDVVPVLNAADLIPSAEQDASRPMHVAKVAETAESRMKSILVVDDSITSRTLLKNILEMAGYQVQTHIDGRAAFTALKTEGFDLVVADVEMPRMDGFELTAAMRADDRLRELPVVLVTSRSAREDRERGIDVGANAYIVKTDFDQGNLLDAVKRLA
jgi:two-component system chemotaxis sensor kinase CheA